MPRFSDLPPDVRLQFEKLKSSVILAKKSEKRNSILFSSYNHGEGTSTVAVNFAESLAQDRNQKVLVVDANTRTPSLHKIAAAHGLNDSLAFSDILTKPLEKLIQPKPSVDCNLSFVTSGDARYHPSHAFDHSRFEKFVASATRLFDFLIFDSSPIGRYYDPIVLASHVDGVILVTQAEKTPCHELRRAKQMLREANIEILGVVLNRRKFHIPDFVFETFLR